MTTLRNEKQSHNVATVGNVSVYVVQGPCLIDELLRRQLHVVIQLEEQKKLRQTQIQARAQQLPSLDG